MPWYKAGTVSVVLNSNAVIGAGTAFIGNSRVGDAFRGPDGRWYEVTNIASDTAMSISPAYQGPTANGGSYALAPMQGYVKESADRLRTLVSQFGSVLAVLGTDPAGVLSNIGGQPKANSLAALSFQNFAADQLPYFSGNSSSALTALTVFARSLLDDTNAATARSTLGLGSAAVMPILGAVGQSNGTPTGAIIERGSNANGEYVRYADGTQVCTFKSRTIRTLGNASGQIFFGGAEPLRNFPINFASAPAIQITAALESGEGWFVGAGSLLNSATAWPSGYVFTQVPRPAQQVCVDYTANGRWF